MPINYCRFFFVFAELRRVKDITPMSTQSAKIKCIFLFVLCNSSFFHFFFHFYLQRHLWHEGWPLTTTSGQVVLHLGTLDESLLRHQDLYICIKPADEEYRIPRLCAIWRSPINLEIICHTLDPDKDSLTPIALEMLADELPQLLQNLLVGVEHTINRIPLDVLTFPHKDDEYNAAGQPHEQQLTNNGHLVLSPIGSPKCALKRRDNITKNKLINGRYALRRMSNKIENDHKNGKSNITETLTTTAATATATTTTTNNEVEHSSMPLFCLGGSFPHIDSDEESGDDLIKTSKGGK